MPTPTATIYLPYHALDDVILRGTRAAQPPAADVVAGTLYCVTDEGARVERSSGTAWQVYSPTPGGGGAGTGDVVGPGAATDQAIALYDGTTGKLIQDSATTIPALTASITASVTADVIPVDLATETTGTLPDARLSANVQLKPIAAADLPAHATRHQPGGADAMAVDAVAATGSLRTLGPGAQQAAPGNDARFTTPSTPAAHHVSHETGGSDAIAALSAAVLTSGTLPDARLSTNIPKKNAANVFTGTPQDLGAGLVLRNTGGPVDQRVWYFYSGPSGYLYLMAMNDALAVHEVVYPAILSRTGNLTIYGDLYEKNRATPMGHWIDVPFNPANYSALAPMVWTVTAGQEATNRYTLLGKTLIWTVAINASTLSGAASAQLNIQLPPGLVVAATMLGGAGFGYIGGTWQPIMVQAAPGTAVVNVFTQNVVPFALGTLYIHFTLSLEIQ